MHVAQWALGSTAVNKASGCDIILVELFKIIRMMLSSVAFNMSANLEDPAVAQDWKRSVFIPIPKKVSTKDCSNHWIIALISHASKVMLKILHSSFSIMQTKNFQMSKLGLEKEDKLEIKLSTFAGL